MSQRYTHATKDDTFALYSSKSVSEPLPLAKGNRPTVARPPVGANSVGEGVAEGVGVVSGLGVAIIVSSETMISACSDVRRRVESEGTVGQFLKRTDKVGNSARFQG